MTEIITERLRLAPLDEAALEARMNAETDAHMKAAYGEMLENGRSHRDAWVWCTEWRIYLLGTGEDTGGLGFKGAPDASGEVEIGYGMDEPFRGRGFATEAARAAVDWAFAQAGVLRVSAEAEADNDASLRVIEKLGMSPCGMGAEGPRFVREK